MVFRKVALEEACSIGRDSKKRSTFRKHGGSPEQLQLGGYDEPIQGEQSIQIPVHQSLVLLDEPKQLPLQPVRELEQDVVMEDNNSAE